MKIIDINEKLEQNNMFFDKNIRAMNNLVALLQYILEHNGIDEAEFMLNHLKNQLENIKKVG